MSALSRQAKAIATAVALFLTQVQVFVGQGGIDALLHVTLGQWITIVVNTLAGYGVVYAIPNVQPPAPAPAVPAAAIVGAPVIDPPGVAP